MNHVMFSKYTLTLMILALFIPCLVFATWFLRDRWRISERE